MNKKGYDLSGLGRWIRGVSTIDVVHAFTNIKGVPNDARPYAPWIVVSGAGIASLTYDLAALQAMPQVTFDASTSTSNTYGIWTGPRLVDVLKASGVNTRDMDSYIVVQGADGYATVYSMYEATHQIGIQDPTTCPGCEPEYVLLAIKEDLKNTINNGTCTDAESAGTACKDGGIVRTVVPGDWQAGRWVYNTLQIMVFKLGR
jgi:DMSO/TMAO reductase YedYZ molybdopterin-dependent catalytic subunit